MLPQLQAEHQLRAIEAADAPHMSAKGRRELFAMQERRLGADAVPAVKPTVRDLARIGICVEYVNADGTPRGDGTQREPTEGDT